MQQDAGDSLTLPFTAFRLTQLNQLVQVCLRNKREILPPSRFTLHMVVGLRLPGGRMQVEHIAGLCHLRGCLKTYAVDQIDSLLDPANDSRIADLPSWLAATLAPPRVDASAQVQQAHARQRAARDEIARLRKSNLVALAIERAIACASIRGLTETADRLSTILQMLDPCGDSEAARTGSAALCAADPSQAGDAAVAVKSTRMGSHGG